MSSTYCYISDYHNTAVCRALGHNGAPCGTPKEIGFYFINIARPYNNTEKYDVAAHIYVYVYIYIYEITRGIKKLERITS